MQTEILKMSDEELLKQLELEAIDYAMEYNKEEMQRIEQNCVNIKQELLKRLSKNRVDKKEFEENDVLLAQYFGKNIEYKEKVIGEFKKKLIEEIEKSYFIPSNKEDQNIIKKLNPLFETYKNKIIDLINN